MVGLATVAAPANAQYATGGTGAYRGQILWFDWGTALNDVPQAGVTVTNTTDVEGLPLAVTCTVGNIAGTGQPPHLVVTRPGEFWGDRLDDLYNIGGTDGANTMDIGLRNRQYATSSTFTFSCSATLDGATYPMQGLVFADAEATESNESIEATLPAGATLRVIERDRAAGCTSSQTVTRTGMTYVQSRPGGLGGCYAVGVYFMDGAVSASVGVHGGGLQAIALGVMLNVADYSDAPLSYGSAGHLPHMSWTGGELPEGQTDIYNATLATQVQPTSALLGALVDIESIAFASTTAMLDDGDGMDDEDSVDVAALVPPNRVMAGSSYSVPLTCVGASPVAGWIDFDRNGTFDADERSATTTCNGGSASLVWTVNGDIAAGQTYLRVRTAEAAADIADPTGLAGSGEVEDYALTIGEPLIRVSKVTTGDVGGPFSFLATNTRSQPDALTTTVEGTPVTGAAVSIDDLQSSVTLSEAAPPAGWELTAMACVDASGGAVANASYDIAGRQLTLPSTAWSAGSEIACTFTNTRMTADVALVKTVSPATAVRTGETVTYTLTASNNGPADVTNALLTDTPGAGLDCVQPGGSATCTASGGAACPSPTLSVGDITGPGVTLPSLPVGGTVVIAMQCLVTASGQ